MFSLTNQSLTLHTINLDLTELETAEPELGLLALDADSVQMHHSVKIDENSICDTLDAIQIDPSAVTVDDDGPHQPLIKNSIKRQILFSLTVHACFVIALIVFNSTQEPMRPTPFEDIKPIQATLYFPNIRQETVAKQTESLLREATAAPEPKVEKEAGTEVEAAPLTPPEVTPSQPPQPENQMAELQSVAKTAKSDTPQTSSADSGSRLQQLNQALSSHLNNLAEQKIQSLTENATNQRAEQFYQQQTQGYQLPVAEPELKIKKIDCSNAASKTVGMFSAMLGGNLRCTEQPDFQRFIDARLGKKPQK